MSSSAQSTAASSGLCESWKPRLWSCVLVSVKSQFIWPWKVLPHLLNLASRLLHLNPTQGHIGDFDSDSSVAGLELRLQRMRCYPQIYTPPPAQCTSLKPEATWSGFIFVPAHTGNAGPHTLIYFSCLSQRQWEQERERERESESEREREIGAAQFHSCTHDEFHFRWWTCILCQKKHCFFLVSLQQHPMWCCRTALFWRKYFVVFWQSISYSFTLRFCSRKIHVL